MEELFITEIFWLVVSWESFFVVSAMVFMANMVTMVLPNKSKYPAVQRLLDVLNFFSMNVLCNANRLYPRAVSKQQKRKKKVSSDRLGGGEP